jgi:hypothetical protein
VFTASAQRTPDSNLGEVTAKADIREEKYCRGYGGLFTVSLSLNIEVLNSSRTPVYLLWPMVPWEGKVASSIGDAESGHFLYDQTASHYPQNAIRFDRLKIEPGKKVTVQSGYDLIARHDPAFPLPKSVSAGTYALVLVLRPEEEPPSQIQGSDTVESITTDPFVIDVPTHPKLVGCDAGAKGR